MFKTFLMEMKSIFKNKWKLLSWIIILFIPTLYGFLYTNAYWKPFHNTEKLNIAIVNLDKSKTSETIVKSIKDNGKKGIGKNEDLLKVNFDSKRIYENSSQVEEDVNNNNLTAALVINKDFEKNQNKIKSDIQKNIIDEFISTITKGQKNINLVNLSKTIRETFKKHENDELVSFYNSLKHNYIGGEMTTIISNLSSYSLSILFPDWSEIKNEIKKLKNIGNLASIIIPELKGAFDLLKNLFSNEDLLIKNYLIDNQADGYGPGLSPFFVSIALWAGSLVMLFMFKNKRNLQHISTIKHYFGKSMSWVLTVSIQSILLTSFLWIQGFYSFDNQWALYLLNIFIGISFALIVQGIGYMFRYGDIGEIVAVIFLVLQLVSSSGVFPVKTEQKIFQVISYVIPFTYSIESVKEIVYGIEINHLLIDLLIILTFAIFFVSTSLIVNIIFDKKHIKKSNNKAYSDFLIPMGDL